MEADKGQSQNILQIYKKKKIQIRKKIKSQCFLESFFINLSNLKTIANLIKLLDPQIHCLQIQK